MHCKYRNAARSIISIGNFSKKIKILRTPSSFGDYDTSSFGRKREGEEGELIENYRWSFKYCEMVPVLKMNSSLHCYSFVMKSCMRKNHKKEKKDRFAVSSFAPSSFGSNQGAMYSIKRNFNFLRFPLKLNIFHIIFNSYRNLFELITHRQLAFNLSSQLQVPSEAARAD